MSNHDEKPTSDFPEELLTPVRRHSESQALIRLQQENTGPVDQLDGPEIEPLTPLSSPKPRGRWVPWLIIGLLLALGVAIWVRHLASDRDPTGKRVSKDAPETSNQGE
ncbi:MAG: hypothetical protein CVU65_12250 [Deltaproteobacteria bacterium HGW-Deltaproteobacteria-22]|jgi:hypothetical protein|nr:MAG: hypothetical protein CVU65_12250 [Deltaproteobacteria bacterium HGW-Deltaproteobacteria-22]